MRCLRRGIVWRHAIHNTWGEGREAVACKQCGASLVFLVIDLPLATHMVGRISNVACGLCCSMGGAMLSLTRRQRYRLSSPVSPVSVVPEATRVSAAASQSLRRLVSKIAVAALTADDGFLRSGRPPPAIVVSPLVPARPPYVVLPLRCTCLSGTRDRVRESVL
jgi:hypothetical protein